jgi:hypothetical protein
MPANGGLFFLPLMRTGIRMPSEMNASRVFKCLITGSFLSLLIPFASVADTPQFSWLKTAGSTGAEVSFSLAVDPAGNSYIAGYFNSTNISFGNGHLITNVSRSSSLPYDIFVAKFTPTGTIAWARGIGGSDDDRARAITVDPQGNCFVTGSSRSTNFVIGGVYLTNSFPHGNSAIFTAKFDGLGNLLWARGANKGTSQSGSGIAVDGFGNCFVTGSFNGTNTFAGTNLISRGNSDVLLLKYNPSGDLLWSTQAGGSGLDAGAAVVADVSGNAYLLANIRGTNAAFDNFSFSANAGDIDQDIIAAKYDSSGHVIWAKQYGGTDLDTGRSIALDRLGNCFIAGDFYSTNLVFGATTLTNWGEFAFGDVFLAKLNSTGNPLWARAAGGAAADSGSACTVDFAGNCYLTGYFQSENLAFGTVSLTNFDNSALNDADAFVAKFAAGGETLWLSPMSGPKDQRAFGIGVDSSANVYATGWTMGTNVLFGTLAATNQYLDIFLTKLDSDFPILQIATIGSNAVISWPTNKTAFVAQYSTNLFNPNGWANTAGGPILLNGRYVVTNQIDSGKKFYRLRR